LKNWSVYIVRCHDNTLYTGVAKDVGRRIEEHNESNSLGARYTRPRRPVRLVYTEVIGDQSAACKREYEIKQLSKLEKESLVNDPIL